MVTVLLKVNKTAVRYQLLYCTNNCRQNKHWPYQPVASLKLRVKKLIHYHYFSLLLPPFSLTRTAECSGHWNTSTAKYVTVLHYNISTVLSPLKSFILTSLIPAGLLGVLGIFLANCFVRVVFVDLYSMPPMLMNLSECFFSVLRKKGGNECMNCSSPQRPAILASTHASLYPMYIFVEFKYKKNGCHNFNYKNHSLNFYRQYSNYCRSIVLYKTITVL